MMMVFLRCYRFFESVILQTLSVVHKVSFLSDTESKMICRVSGMLMTPEKYMSVLALWLFQLERKSGIAGRGKQQICVSIENRVCDYCGL